MPTAAPSWGTCRTYGTWHSHTGEMLSGTYSVSVPVRITNATDDVIVPAGLFASGTLNTTPGQPSFDLALPASDDPDNSPTGWQVTVKITFANGVKGEEYVLSTPLGGEINLRTVMLPATIPTPEPGFIKGVPGGLAALDADGDVIDADGVKVTGSDSGAYATTAQGALADTAVQPADLERLATDADLAAALGNTVATNDPRLADARTPLAHSAALVTSGTLAVARVPALPTSKVTGLDAALAAKVGSGNGTVTGIEYYASEADLPATGTPGVIYVVPVA